MRLSTIFWMLIAIPLIPIAAFLVIGLIAAGPVGWAFCFSAYGSTGFSRPDLAFNVGEDPRMLVVLGETEQVFAQKIDFGSVHSRF